MKILIKISLITLLFISGNSYAVEITPLLGYRGGGEFIDTETGQKHTINSSEIYGLIIGFPYQRGEQIEIYYSHQSSDLNSVNINIPALAVTNNTDIPLSIDYLHIGGTTPIYDEENLKTFLSGGLGFTYLSPDLSGLQSDLRASFSIGIGLKWPVTKNMALRLETRGLATLFNSNAALFCNGGCSLTVNGSLFFQAEVFAGLAVRF
jgi:opacity protein-like surface antigen